MDLVSVAKKNHSQNLTLFWDTAKNRDMRNLKNPQLSKTSWKLTVPKNG